MNKGKWENLKFQIGTSNLRCDERCNLLLSQNGYSALESESVESIMNEIIYVV